MGNGRLSRIRFSFFLFSFLHEGTFPRFFFFFTNDRAKIFIRENE